MLQILRSVNVTVRLNKRQQNNTCRSTLGLKLKSCGASPDKGAAARLRLGELHNLYAQNTKSWLLQFIQNILME